MGSQRTSLVSSKCLVKLSGEFLGGKLIKESNNAEICICVSIYLSNTLDKNVIFSYIAIVWMLLRIS